MKLHDLIAEFDELEPEDRLDLLHELALELPDLPPEIAAESFPAECRVQECQTVVYLWTDVQNGQVRVYADAPRKSPTVRGLVALLVLGFDGQPTADVLAAPDDLLEAIGLSKVLGMTRKHGVGAMLTRIKRRVTEALASF